MNLTLLLPQAPPASAIEERYARWQNELLMRKGAAGARVVRVDASQSASETPIDPPTEYLLLVTDFLTVPPPDLAQLLIEALEEEPDAAAAIPMMNQSGNPHQQRDPVEPYLTLRQFERVAEDMAGEAQLRVTVEWDGVDPGICLVREEAVRASSRPWRSILEGKTVVLPSDVFCHRYSSLRGQLRTDLLDRISTRATSVLEFGCGEAALGFALKNRQGCRVVGVELDREAAAIAAGRIDAVHMGDVRDIARLVDERFDWIVGGDIVEHLDEPWSFLASLRQLASEGAHLLLSLPNIASWPIIADLLAGRFDYLYMGITCAGHLRFFTRRSIEEMLEIAGWETVFIEPQDPFVTPELTELEQRLQGAGVPYSRDEFITPGYYVLARNPGGGPR